MICTPLTELLGIRYPIVQAAMGYVSGPRLAAADSDAGGHGLIASATMSLAELEKAIEETAGQTAGPCSGHVPFTRRRLGGVPRVRPSRPSPVPA